MVLAARSLRKRAIIVPFSLTWSSLISPSVSVTISTPRKRSCLKRPAMSSRSRDCRSMASLRAWRGAPGAPIEVIYPVER